MAGQPGAGRGPGRPEIIKLGSVQGFVVLDLPDAAFCAGGTRLAPDVTITEVALLARAMTYKIAAQQATLRRRSRATARWLQRWV